MKSQFKKWNCHSEQVSIFKRVRRKTFVNQECMSLLSRSITVKLTPKLNRPSGIHDTPEWPSLGPVLLALYHLHSFERLLKEHDKSVWTTVTHGKSKDKSSASESFVIPEVLRLFQILKHSRRKYASPSGLGNLILDVTSCPSIPQSVSGRVSES